MISDNLPHYTQRQSVADLITCPTTHSTTGSIFVFYSVNRKICSGQSRWWLPVNSLVKRPNCSCTQAECEQSRLILPVCFINRHKFTRSSTHKNTLLSSSEMFASGERHTHRGCLAVEKSHCCPPPARCITGSVSTVTGRREDTSSLPGYWARKVRRRCWQDARCRRCEIINQAHNLSKGWAIDWLLTPASHKSVFFSFFIADSRGAAWCDLGTKNQTHI